MTIRTLIFILTFLLIPQIHIFADSYILVDKPALKIYVIEKEDTVFVAPICVGLNHGDKEREGDCKTPEGKFTISQIQNSKSWKHDFKDGYGLRTGAYGPWFFRLKTPKWTSIGIHGTCFPESIGTRSSEGCVRLNNEDLIILRKMVRIGMEVIVIPDNNDYDV